MPPQPTATPPRIRSVQRTALTVLVLAGTLNYIDRATLSVANPLIRNELGLSIADMGLLLSAFLWAYAFFQLPGGALVDRVGPRRLLTVGLTVWSVAQAAAGLITSFAQFSIARVFLGLGEAPMFSSCATGSVRASEGSAWGSATPPRRSVRRSRRPSSHS